MKNCSFKYNIGDIVNNLLVLDRFYKGHEKYYSYECQIDHYIGEIKESHLYNGHGCPICSNNAILIGVNDMWATNPKMASMLQDKFDGYCYGENSTQKVDWVCPTCKREIKNKAINKVKIRGLLCPFCSDGESYPNKFMNNLLKELKVDYIREFSPLWAENKKYDFAILSNKLIIEMDGGFHYRKNTFDNSSYEKAHAIDKYKNELATLNGYKVIRINCDYRSLDKRFEYIKSNIISALQEIFNFDNIDFKMIDKISLESSYLKSIEMYNSGYDVDFISDNVGLHKETVRKYLISATKNNLCNFNLDRRIKPIVCTNTNQCFNSISLCERLSSELFGVTLSNKNMARQIKLGKPYKGFLFRYISIEEFNKLKQESPELCFGDSFI